MQYPPVVVCAFSCIFCLCLTKINPAPSPPSKIKSPSIVAIVFPPNLLLVGGGVITGGISRGAVVPASIGVAPAISSEGRPPPGGAGLGIGGVSSTVRTGGTGGVAKGC